MNRESFEDEIRKSEQTLYRVSKTILNEEADCEDAVQEAILKAYEKLDTLREDAYFKTWMIRILINECYKIGRLKKGIASYDDCLENLDAEPEQQEQRDYSELYHAVSMLPQRIRIVIVLYYVEEYSVEEIKKILGIPAGTVKSRLSTGRKRMKKILENSGTEEVQSVVLFTEGSIRHENI